ncbi:MAG: hypothetical protein DWQ07_23480 [Chloroflexi bacterium]|nr:MAG: hypothetical protein DWQ07_23480 [Chloroflexota bacterium]MBL1194112.1 hypothetical protein [Chloroflexota bacterium]NOH11405.1 hypothetical protein [Chloroflexota bacterium]
MPSNIKQCPYCAEDIKAAAIVCKHCGRQLPEYDGEMREHQRTGENRYPLPKKTRWMITLVLTALVFLAGLAAIVSFFNINGNQPEPFNPPIEPTVSSVFSQSATAQAQPPESVEPTDLLTTAPQATPTPIPTGAAEVVIPASEAHEYEGQSITVEIPKAYCSYRSTINGEPTFCNDQPFPGHNFTLVV